MIAYFIPAREKGNVKFLRITNVSANLVSFSVSADGLENQIEDFSFAFFEPEELENRGNHFKEKVNSR